MATKSRTYLPTDWQVWVYQPVTGKFRLDFSTLNGTDVLGGPTDLGTLAVMPLNIASIQVNDGGSIDSSVFGNATPATMSLTATMTTYLPNTVKELYNGKPIYLTLKNEATYSDPTFGKNTVFFAGFIDSLDVSIDPINRVTSLTITATDIIGAAMNVPLTINKDNTLGQDNQITAAFQNAYLNMPAKLASSLNSLITAPFELNGNETKTYGEWLTSWLTSQAAIFTSYIYHSQIDGYKRYVGGKTISANSQTGELIPESIITDVTLGQDGGNVPTSFDLANTTGTYLSANLLSNTLSNSRTYSDSIDVPTTYLATIANKISSYTQNIQPVQITVKTAQTFSPITFSNARPVIFDSDYFYPTTFFSNTQEVKTQISYIGGGTNYHTIVATSHNITPDDWETTYQLWKGL